MKNKIRAILLSFVIALGMWLFVITVEQPESEKTYYNIPVVLQNEAILAERGLMITSEQPTVTLQLSSTRTNLNQLNETNINVIANVNSIVTPGTHELAYSISYPGNIPSGSITRKSQKPDMVTLKVENRITKQVPVVPEYTGTVPSGLLADKEHVVLDYAYIEVSGPESVMEQIEKATVAVDLTEQTQTIVAELPYTLCDAEGAPVDSQWVTTNVEVVNLTLTIQRVKEVRLKVNVIAGGGATEQTSTISIEPSTILISGSEALLDGLDVLELGTINLGEIELDQTLILPITLPEGITNETGITEATVEVKFPNLKTTVLSINNIQLVNIPEGMDAELVTQVLEVKLRGPAAMIEAITADNVKITVDLSQAQIGTDKYVIELVVDSAYYEVGALNSYTVMVTVTQAEDE